MIRQATTCNGGSLEKRFLTAHVEGAVGDVRTVQYDWGQDNMDGVMCVCIWCRAIISFLSLLIPQLVFLWFAYFSMINSRRINLLISSFMLVFYHLENSVCGI